MNEELQTTEHEKRKHSIADWTLTVMFSIIMIAIIFSMKNLMATHRELFLSAVIMFISIFAYAKIRLAKWGKRL